MSEIKISTKEYEDLLKLRNAVRLATRTTVSRLSGSAGQGIKEGEFFIGKLHGFRAGQPVVILKEDDLPKKAT
jgi:hypothetical protein